MPNKQSKIEKLLIELCPNGIDFKELKNISDILNGYSFKSSKYSKNGIRIIRISDVQKGKMSDKNLKYYPIETENKIARFLLKENDLVMSLTGNVGRVAMLSKSDLPAGLNQRVACIRVKDNKVLTRYLFHFFDQDNFEIEAMANATGGGQKNMSTTWLGKFKIPIPPLPIQEEIVKILDSFTELEAELESELEAELEARKKQYEYYRDKLLNAKDVGYKSLGEISEKIYSGGTPKTEENKYWDGGDIPWMSSGEVNYETIYKTENFITEVGLKNSSAKYVPKNSVVIALAGQGKTRGKVARTRIDLTTNQSLAAITFNKNKINSDYVFHFLKSQYLQLRQVSSGDGTRGGLNLKMISNYKIPVPPLSEQNRIVLVLDKFDALVNDISIGLLAELKARRQQYEYYRNKLLTFKEYVG